jgi:Flp pilus assembly protein TadD
VTAALVLATVLQAAAAAGAEPGRTPAAGIARVPIGWRPSHSLVRGVDLWANRQYARALEQFRAATRHVPSDPVAWHNLGVALLRFDRDEEALDAFRRERFFRPRAPSAWYGMGLANLKLGRDLEAERDFIMGVIEAPREWTYWHALAEALARQGKTAEAREAGRKAALLKPRPARVRWTPPQIDRYIVSLKIPRISTVR